MKIYVTGARGFTGQYVIQALQQAGHQAIACAANLLDRNALKQDVLDANPDAVIHLAAVAFVAHGDADAFYHVNVIGTRHLLEALEPIKNQLHCVLLASSANVYGNHTEGVLSESDMLSPQNDYAISKMTMELMASLWFDRLPLVITRPFNYTGIGQADYFVIPKIVKHFRDRCQTIALGNINVFREFNDVRMIAQSYVALIEQAPLKQTINVCTGRSYALQDVLDLCQTLSGHPIKVEINPEFIRANEVHELKGNNAKLLSLCQALPDYELEKTLSWMLNAE